MKININNYEAYLLDHFEGNLPETLSVDLLRFLEENPQIDVDWDGFETIALKAEHAVFENKHQLYRIGSELMGLSKADFLMVKQLEEGLTVDEKLQLDGLVKANLTLAEEVKQMACARLSPGIELFEAKSNIKRLSRWSLFTLQRARQVAAILLVALMATTVWLVVPSGKNDEPFLASTLPNDQSAVDEKVVTEGVMPMDLVVETIELKKNHHPSASLKAALANNKKEDSAKPVTLLVARQPMEPLEPRPANVGQSKVNVNAYELGVNHMMPLYVALLQNDKTIRAEPLVTEAPRNLSLLEGGIKVLNVLSGSDIRLNKELDNSGKVVAYSVQTENAIINKQVRR